MPNTYRAPTVAPTPTVTRQSQRRISWDLLRVLAVFSVVLQHATHQGPASHPELGPAPFDYSLQVGANTLLLISAFFICGTLRRSQPRRWWWHRVARLLPPYLVAVVVTYVVTTVVVVPDWYRPTVGDLVGNLLFAQAWCPGVHYIDGAYWTLPVQLLSYSAAALLWLTRWARRWRLRVLLWGLVVVPVVLRLTWRTDDAPQLVRSLFDGLGLHRAHVIAAGVAIWLWVNGRCGVRHLAALLATAVFAHEVQTVDLPATMGFAVVLAVICLAAAGPDWDVPGLRTLSRPVAWLAGISFGVYLLNQEIGEVVTWELLRRGVGPWVSLGAAVLVAVLLGWLLTRLVERPAHRWLTARARGWQRPARLVTDGGQIKDGSDGGWPTSSAPASRPASHASTLAPVPRTTEETSPVLASSHVR